MWIYWPSFVAGAAVADSLQQQRAIVNTILALAASTVAAFWGSSVLSKNGRFRPVDVQNATLAGGVAIGCVANLTLSGFSAVMIGVTAGLVSTFGYNVLQPFLEERIGLHDTCGVHNLHAMPSVVGGLSSVIIAGYKGTLGRSHDVAIYGKLVDVQWGHQWAGIVLCIAFAITTGFVTGHILKLLSPNRDKIKTFHDGEFWEVAKDYGESLYSELALIVGDERLKSEILQNIPEWSSHSGRRGGGGRLEWSSHGSSHNGRRGRNYDPVQERQLQDAARLALAAISERSIDNTLDEGDKGAEKVAEENAV